MHEVSLHEINVDNSPYCHRLLSLNIARAELPEGLTDDTPVAVSTIGLYRISTCSDLCRGGDHIIEQLCGRAFNHASAAITLISMGYYDEALSLCRSLGELANLFALFIQEPHHFKSWAEADRKARLKVYSPGAVRKILEKPGRLPMPISQNDYQDLCETATHFAPKTVPNQFGAEGQKIVGPFRQDAGVEKCMATLSNILPYIAMMAAKMTGNEPTFARIEALAR